MFKTPRIDIPQSITEASNYLNDANVFISTCVGFQRSQFQKFWFTNGVLKSKEEINSVLEAMDLVAPGQSTQFFQAAKKLVDLILAIMPNALEPVDWMPPYEYEVDPITFALKVK